MNYYYISCIGLLAKGGDGIFTAKYIYDKDQGWVEDRWSIVNDYLAGYDSSEEPGSPYGFADSSIMDEVETITKTKAERIRTTDYQFTLGDDPQRWNP